MSLTISQLNRIGEDLRKKIPTEEDLHALDEFRLSFQPAYQKVFAKLTAMGLSPGGRPQKTTLSIIAKLRRERSRLSKIQDIAGCRVVVETMAEQNKVVDELKLAFPKSKIFDRRKAPSHSYRAVHVVVSVDGVPVEVQVRTELQHAWAELSEKISDVFDPQVKYGGGPAKLRNALDRISSHVEAEENQEAELRVLRERASDEVLKNALEHKQEQLRARRLELHGLCRELIMVLEGQRKS